MVLVTTKPAQIATLLKLRYLLLIISFLLVVPAHAATLLSSVQLESGKIMPKANLVDGLAVWTLKDNTYVGTSSGGADANSGWDTRVVPSDIVKGETVSPRLGSYFMRSEIFLDKNYLPLNGNSTDPYFDKPRSVMLIGQDLEFDKDYWFAMSIYVPTSWEEETATTGTPGATQVLAINASPSATLLAMHITTPPNGTRNHWIAQVQTNPYSVDESDSRTDVVDYDMGEISGDRGKWTDFVIHFRSNPFPSPTNPGAAGIANAVNATYQGNKGIMEIWKTSGASRTGNISDYTKYVNIVNAPVGLVPWAGEPISVNPRIYKYGWKRNATNVVGPIWMGFDEMKLGATTDGVGFNDVAPNGAADGSSVITHPPQDISKLLFLGDYEVDQITVPGTAGSGLPIKNTFWYSGMGPNCDPRGNDPRPDNGSRLVTGNVLTGQKAMRQEVRYDCDYRPFNEGDPRPQKPRTETKANHPNAQLEVGKIYWVAFGFYLEQDFIYDYPNNPDNLFQMVKEESGTTGELGKDLMAVGLHGGKARVTFQHPDGLSTATPDTKEWAATRGMWHKVVFNFRLCKTTTPNCSGFIKMYLNDSDTPFYEDTGPNTISDTHHTTVNLYKYAWHCTGNTRYDYNACMQNPNPTHHTTANGPRFVTFDDFNIGGENATIYDVMPSWGGGSIPSGNTGPNRPSVPLDFEVF